MENNPSYQSFSGSDIVATFNGQVIGELLSLTYSVTREKAPTYTMGSANPRGFARGKRGIAGNLVFAVFNRNALLEQLNSPNTEGADETMKKNMEDNSDISVWGHKGSTVYGDLDDDKNFGNDEGVYDPIRFNELMQAAHNSGNGDLFAEGVVDAKAKYADQLRPFDITINYLNEMGEQAKMALYGVEILNEGMGMSIQDLSSNISYTFVARDIEELHEVE